MLSWNRVLLSLFLSFNLLENAFSYSSENFPRDLSVEKSLHFFKGASSLTISRSNLYEYYTEHFVIYYGKDYPKIALWSDTNHNLIPDYVENIAQILEEIWLKEVIEFNLGKPYGEIPIPVYIANTGIDINGKPLKLPEEIAGLSSVIKNQGIIIINAEPPYSLYTKPMDILKVSLAHEFFHLIQIQG